VRNPREYSVLVAPVRSSRARNRIRLATTSPRLPWTGCAGRTRGRRRCRSRSDVGN